MTDKIRKKALERFAVEGQKEEHTEYSDNLFDVDEISCTKCNETHHIMPKSANEYPKDQWCYKCQDMMEFKKSGEIRY